MGTRRRSRELALQLLYQNELTDAPPEAMQEGFDEWQSATEGVREFADRLLRGTLSRLAEIDARASEAVAEDRCAEGVDLLREALSLEPADRAGRTRADSHRDQSGG